MNIRKNRFLTLSLIAGLGFGMQACTDEEIAVGVGVVAIGAGVAIIAGAGDDDGHDSGHDYDDGYDYDDHYDRCEGGYVRKCTTYTDYWGDEVRECRREWDSCANRRRGGYRHHSNDDFLYSANLMQTASLSTSATLASVQPAAATGKKVVTSDWAAQFGMSFEGAELFVSSLEAAKEGNIKALADLGLGQKDIERLAKVRMPSFKGIDALAKTLNMSKSNTRKMVRSLINEAKNQKDSNCRKVGGLKNKVKVCS